ncbi:MAG: 30S ribosomal protein S16 [Planctomycetaceae bacterium]|nr:30S ribosomal protein S16 [Planctomycetaceae bacterium]
MKRLGRRHRPFYRICAMDSRSPRDGKVIEELGYYDPMVRETDARAILQSERIDYWISQGALPTEKVKVLIDKYGTNGSCLDRQKEALERLATQKPVAPPPQKVPLPEGIASAEKQESSQADAPKSEETAAETPPASDAVEAASEPAAATEAASEPAAATEAASEPDAAESESLGDVGQVETSSDSEQTESEENTESK